MGTRLYALVVLSALAASAPAKADKLDDIIASGVLRCAVTLDFPPMGSRDASNNPIGFDVDTCNDLAKVLGVKAEIVETPFPDRIPALVSAVPMWALPPPPIRWSAPRPSASRNPIWPSRWWW